MEAQFRGECGLPHAEGLARRANVDHGDIHCGDASRDVFAFDPINGFL